MENSEQQAYMSRVLKTLERQNHALATEQSARFGKLSSQLDVLLQRIHALSGEGSTPPDRSQLGPHGSRSRAAQTIRLEDVAVLGDIFDGLGLAEKDLTAAAKEHCLLSSLNFRTRTYRHEDIPEAHKATFAWIFSDQERHQPPDSAADATETPSGFKAWLASGRGTFWISGKAGSGKSTLVKFVAGHAKTRSALQTGAGPHKVVIASHYFWSAGTAMQKSLKGLLQELVFDVLCRCPELAHDVFPHRLQTWTTAPGTISTAGSPGDDVWTVRELREGLRQIADHPALPIRCCFFVDGLDEYSGDHIELCQILKDLATSDNLKCCVSSRPWNVFEDAFGGGAAFLRVHELTYNDIRLFTRSRLHSNARWRQMGIDDAQRESLARYITEHAQGVFLWVFLVTKYLREGVIDGDTFADLQRRLEVVPTELEPYFKHMLDCVDAFHHSYMAQTLQMALNAEEPLDLAVYYAAEHELADANYALSRPPDFDVRVVNLHPEFYKPCRRRINARCGGLLGFKKHGVEFIHRTVHDFLQTGAMQDYLASKALPGLHPSLSTLRAMVFLFRCVVRRLATTTGDASLECMETLWAHCLQYACGALEEDEDATTRLLDALPHVHQEAALADQASLVQEAIGHIVQKAVVFTAAAARDATRGSRSKTLARRSRMGPGDAAAPGLQHMYLQGGLERYVLAKLHSNPRYFDAPNVSLLATVLGNRGGWTTSHVDVVLLLLERGCDPNEALQERHFDSPWHTLVGSFDSPWHTLVGSSDLITTPIGCALLAAFLRHGASRARSMRYNGTNVCAVRRFLDRNLEAPTQLEIQAVFDAVDVFLEAAPEDNRVQLEDILLYVQTWQAFPPMPAQAEEKRATAAFMDKLVARAVQLRLPADAFFFLMINAAFRACVSPRTFALLDVYMQSNGVAVPASLLNGPEPRYEEVDWDAEPIPLWSALNPHLEGHPLKHQHSDGDLDDAGQGAKRPKTESGPYCHSGDSSNPIAID